MERELETLRDLQGTDAGSRAVLRAPDGTERPVPESVALRIYSSRTADGWSDDWVELKLDRGRGSGGVEVHGGGPLVIFPEVSNGFTVRVRRHAVREGQ